MLTRATSDKSIIKGDVKVTMHKCTMHNVGRKEDLSEHTYDLNNHGNRTHSIKNKKNVWAVIY